MKKKYFLAIILSIHSSISFSQDWVKYSDSIISNIRKGNNATAKYFLQLAEQDLLKENYKKDTTYADFLYRKGVLNYLDKKNPENNFKESLSIWNKSDIKNFNKIIRINFFFADYLYSINNYKKSYNLFREVYRIGIKVNFNIDFKFFSTLYALYDIDRYVNKDLKLAKKWANNYFTLFQNEKRKTPSGALLKMLSFIKPDLEYYNLLEGYLDTYNTTKVKNIENLQVLLVGFMSYYRKKENYSKTIEYGLKLLESYKVSNNDSSKGLVYKGLILAYNKIGDNINYNKYIELDRIEFPDSYIDYYGNLQIKVIKEDYQGFEKLFKVYESQLIEDKNFNDLLEIYFHSLTLYEKGIIYTNSDIQNQKSLIEKNIKSLSQENETYFDFYNAEYSFFTKDFAKTLQIANKYLDYKDNSFRLAMYKMKASSEMLLGKNGKKTAYKALEIAQNLYVKNSPQILPYLNLILSVNVGAINGEDYDVIKIGTKALEIIYKNNLGNTDIAAQVWSNLGRDVSLIGNYKDGELYYKNSISIYESSSKISNVYVYYSSLLALSSIFTYKSNFKESLKYLKKTKTFLDNTSNLMDIVYGDYYYYLGDYFFWQDKFQEAKINYEKALGIYGENLTQGRDFNLILCDYFLNNNIDLTVKALEKYIKINDDKVFASKVLYLFKFNTFKIKEAREILLASLTQIQVSNNKYFHLLSDNEKETLYKRFTNEFEFLSTHLLLNNDPLFLKEYIQKRFYFKSLLFSSNSQKVYKKEEAITSLDELNSNTVLINKYYEQEKDYLKEINNLQQKNRELEKFLAQTNSKIKTPTIDQIKTELNDKSAYVEIIRINKQVRSATKDKLSLLNTFTDSIYYGAIIIKKNKDPKFVIIDKSNKLENKHLDNFSKFIKGDNKFLKDKTSYSVFFEPLEDELNGIKNIFLVTDGIYNSINLETFFNPKNGKYIIDYLNINRIISARSLMNRNPFNDSDNNTATLIGNPEFELESVLKQKENQIVLRDYDIEYVKENNKFEKQISYLPGTEREINSIGTILTKAKFKVNLFASQDAKEINLKKVKSPKILHLATHGYFLRIEKEKNSKKYLMGLQSNYVHTNTYLKSGLLLTGAQNTLNGDATGAIDNGVFTALEARNLDLKETELVVLSACETGLGDALIGDGVYGLQRAFMIAGAKSVIMSFWKVNDNTTQKLMQLFYENWIGKGMKKNKAFREAKLELKKEYPEPYFWAPFILIE